ncbi:head-tail adaptor protein [Xinfangfangia sp. D13-10-4-6]|uniref:head-tail adaptor protein n=1 Tax=Pseudogemmobacter hezensis TaxID=2737662 RepID=UPI001554B08D|nr:head-tail adaptor protein [Pseudogemmobacter hezensis]NPD15365.1 head-tail adaptor protein [Pseudogemmobacter hezensis]
MKAPHLRQQLALEEASRSPDGAGGFSLSWVLVGLLWAEMSAGSGRDAAGEEVVLTSVAWRITVRGAAPGMAERPKPGQRFRLGPRIFTILAVAESDASGRWLTCTCREEAPK